MKHITLYSFTLFLIVRIGFSQVNPMEIIEKNHEALKPYKTFSLENDDMHYYMKGKMDMADFKGIPFEMWFSEGRSRTELEILGAKAIDVSLDTLTWSWDSFGGGYSFGKPEELFDLLGFKTNEAVTVMQLYQMGWEPTSVSETRLDSLDVYDLRMLTVADSSNNIDSGLEYSFLIDKRNFYLVGVRYEELSEYSLRYKVLNGYVIPTVGISLGGEDGSFIMTTEKMEFREYMSDSLFALNEEGNTAYLNFLANGGFNPIETSSVQTLFEQGVKSMETNDYSEAIKLFNKALELNSEDNVVLNRRGLAKLYSNDLYGAIADFGRAMEFADSTEHPTLYNNLGLAKYYLGDYKGARVDYQEALKSDSMNLNFNQNMGLLMFKFKDYEAIEKYYTRAIIIDSTSSKAYYYRGVGRAELSNYEQALNDYTQAENYGLDAPELYNYRGVSEYNLGNFEAASISVKKAIERDSSNNQYIFNLAEIYEQLDDYQSAIKQYDFLLTRDSTFHSVYASRGLAYWELAMTKAARRDIEKAIELSPENALYYDYRAYLREEAGDYTGAIDDFTTSLNLEQDANIYYRRGVAKINISNKFDACKDFKKAEELGSDEAKSALAEYCKL
ncbi:MAG: tetratricopeptide repeat protein [Cytophagia bacterium]|nr:tetratricopeptide repeat protein [Cytophagia bacterium]